MPKLLGIFFVLLLFIYLLFFSPFLKIKSLEIIGGNNCINSQNLLVDFGLGEKNYFLITKSQIESLLKKRYSCVKEISIKKTFPLKIDLEVKTQSEVLKIENINLFLTEDGIVTDTSNHPKLPILYPGRNLNLKVGQKIEDETIAFVLVLTLELAKSDFATASVRIVDQDSVAVYNTQDLIAIFSFKKPITEQVDSLQLVLSKAKIDAAKIAKIDLRFDKPIIVNK